MSTFKFSDVLDAAVDVGKPIDDGVYNAVVTKAEATTTKKGKLAFKVSSKVTEGPKANTPITQWVNFSPESPVALGFFKRDMKGYGASPEYLATDPDPQEVADRLVGSLVEITVKARDEESSFVNVADVKYLGKSGENNMVPNVAAVAPSPAPAPAPAAPAPATPTPVAAEPTASPGAPNNWPI